MTGPSEEQRAAGRARRAAQRLRRAAAEAPAPTTTDPWRLPEPEEREAHLVLDLALRAGEVLLSGGAGAADVTATTMAIANAYGLRYVECDITFTSISLAYVRGPDLAPVTSMRLVRRRVLDYTRVSEANRLIEDIVEGGVDRPTATERLEVLRNARHPYRSWTVTAARSTLAGSVAVLLGAGPVVTSAGFLATVVVDRSTRWLDGRNWPTFYQNAVGGLIATVVALAMFASGIGVRPSLVVAAGIILLLPGVTLVGSVQDAITGYLVTAAARAFEVVLLTAGIVTGVALGLELGFRLGVEIAMLDPPAQTIRRVPVQLFAAGIAAAAFAMANYAPRRTLAGAWLAGAIGYATLLGATRLELSPAFATAAAATVVGVGSFAVAHRQHAPPLIYLTSGIIPLLPGLTIYLGMLGIGAQGDTFGGLVTLASAATIGLAIAAGAILGEFLAQPVRRNVSRFERRLVGPRLAGPLRWRRRD